MTSWCNRDRAITKLESRTRETVFSSVRERGKFYTRGDETETSGEGWRVVGIPSNSPGQSCLGILHRPDPTRFESR